MKTTTLLALALFGSVSPCLAEPGPGDIFKEFHWNRGRVQFIFSPGNAHPDAPKQKPPTLPLVLDLDGATKAEVVVEYWSGHPGTSAKTIRFNDHDWIALPLPQNTPTGAECYFAIVSQPAVEVPLGHLKPGTNTFTFNCGPQLCHDFSYASFGVYGVTVRVYYSAAKPHAEGRIVSHQSGAKLDDGPVFEVAAPEGVLKRVDFIAEYEDFAWGGNGVFRQWHYEYNFNKLQRHVGTATAAPWRVKWNTEWVADQRQPMRLIARVTDTNGVICMTPIVDGLAFQRSRSVRFYPASGVKQLFDVRDGARAACTINWVVQPRKAAAARLVFASHGPHESPGEFGLNGKRLGIVEPQPVGRGFEVYHEVDVPLDMLKTGDNEFYIHSATKGHALEGLWPGPALFLMLEK